MATHCMDIYGLMDLQWLPNCEVSLNTTHGVIYWNYTCNNVQMSGVNEQQPCSNYIPSNVHDCLRNEESLSPFYLNRSLHISST